MDVAVGLAAVAGVIAGVIAFYIGLRAYSRRQTRQGHKSSDID
jgi:hypothetical protein